MAEGDEAEEDEEEDADNDKLGNVAFVILTMVAEVELAAKFATATSIFAANV